MDGVLDYHQFYVFISDAQLQKGKAQQLVSTLLERDCLAVYLVFTLAGLLVEGTRDRDG